MARGNGVLFFAYDKQNQINERIGIMHKPQKNSKDKIIVMIITIASAALVVVGIVVAVLP